MDLEFDATKDAANIAKHGMSLAAAVGLDLLAAAVFVDDRHDYGETRFRAFGRIGEEGFCLAFTVRDTIVRPISFRRAHEKEMRKYDR